MSTKAPAKKADMGPTQKVATKKLSDHELSVIYARESLKASKLPKEYKAFILKAFKDSSYFTVPLHMRANRKPSRVTELLGYLSHEDTVEYGFDDNFWYSLEDAIMEFEDGDIEACDLTELPNLGTTKRFDMLDYPVCVSSEEGLAVGCQSMDRDEFVKFLRDVAPIFGLKVVKK